MLRKRDPGRPGRNNFYVKQMMQPTACIDPDDFACQTANLNLRNIVKAMTPERNTQAEFDLRLASAEEQAEASGGNTDNNNGNGDGNGGNAPRN